METIGKNEALNNALNQIEKKFGKGAVLDMQKVSKTSIEVIPTELGVDVNSLIVSQSSSGEEALEIAETLIRSNSIDIIVIDKDLKKK